MGIFNLFGKRDDTQSKQKTSKPKKGGLTIVRSEESLEDYSGIRVELFNQNHEFMFVARMVVTQGGNAQLQLPRTSREVAARIAAEQFALQTGQSPDEFTLSGSTARNEPDDDDDDESGTPSGQTPPESVAPPPPPPKPVAPPPRPAVSQQTAPPVRRLKVPPRPGSKPIPQPEAEAQPSAVAQPAPSATPVQPAPPDEPDEPDEPEEPKIQPFPVFLRGYEENLKKAIHLTGEVAPVTEAVWKAQKLLITGKDNDRSFFRQEASLSLSRNSEVYPANLPEDANESSVYPCELRNISAGGVCIRVPVEFKQGEQIVFCANMPRHNLEPLLCEIRRVTKMKETFEYGCQFLELTETDQDEIAKIIVDMQQEQIRRQMGE